MTIEIDTDLLLKHNLNANQFMLAYLLYKGEYTIITDLIESVDKNTLKSDLEHLENERFVHDLNTGTELDLSSIIVRNKFMSLFKADVDIFEELLELYPVKVQRPDGFYDYLRTDAKRCKARYNRIVAGRMSKHDRILKALKYELDTRKAEGSMMYMKRLPKWLSSEEWKVFEERMKDDAPKTGNQSYGTELE